MATLANLDISALCSRLQPVLEAAKGERFNQAIVNTPFNFAVETALLFLGFICFFLVDEHKQIVYLVQASDNDYYHKSVDEYDKFDAAHFELALDDTKNSIARAVVSGKTVSTRDWDTMRRPRVKDGVARLNQASGGIGYSVVVPLKGKRRGALMYNYFQDYDAIGKLQEQFMRQYTKLVSDMLA